MIDTWLAALEQRHLADLTFSETARALRALSSTYVERRDRLARKSAFDTAGKRAAYALYYSPLHFLTVLEVVRALKLETRKTHHVLDLGCGAGAAGAVWAMHVTPPAEVTGVDAHPWALNEAAFTYRTFGLRGETRREDASRIHIPKTVDAVVAGWMINELSETARTHVQRELLQAAQRGATVLIIEPIATRILPWWTEWATTVSAAGGRADEWRFPVQLPELIRRFDRAAGLRHDELKARSLLLNGASNRKCGLDRAEE